MKICILGSGALGSAIGGALAEAGSEVYLINRRKEYVNSINAKGLILRSGIIDRTIKVQARTDCKGIGPVDLIIVLVKSFHTKQAIEDASELIGDQTMIMSLQNGLGNEEILAEVVGKERLLGGKTYVGGVMLGPGHVLAGIKNKYTYIGELDGSITGRVSRVSEVFTKAGLLTVVSSNIIGIIWDKLLINVATGALSGITKLTYGDLYKIPEIRDCAFEAISEGIAVAKANGVALSVENPEEIWLKAAEGLPDEFKTSMLQSLEKGSVTEIDFINGAVVRWGERSNIPTPVNKALVANIKGIEYWIKNNSINV
ncbi:ketopantoate reductase family protein [Bacillus sp. FJAT-29790]|uniref:ketopantoate reductase family protein n=1 Tax=Bacillus sp. FJAT-29790 TaxID=1895002 RepID=UPI001C226D7C|nr:ketopantoate reductase family protein [Bacillus sp. FJAT-29790]MBU8881355.1 ketopantoate reductase family protein [Bacillus sp. FJAT-29790]